MGDQGGIGQVNQHVQSLPDGCGQLMQPEIVTGRCHEKEDQQSDHPKRLEGQPRDAFRVGARSEDAEDRINRAAEVVEG